MALKQVASVLKCPVLLATGQDDAPKHASRHGGARLIQHSDGSSLRTGGLNPARLERLAAIERWHFWFRGRQQLVEELLKKYLPGHPILLDIGCGTGWGLDNLARCGYRAIGLDMRPEGLRTVRQRSRDVGLVQADATRLPIAEASFAGIVLLDVMEHVDDAALLREVRSVVRPGGTVIIS